MDNDDLYDNALVALSDACAAMVARHNVRKENPDGRNYRFAWNRLRIIWAARQRLLDCAIDPGERHLLKIPSVARLADVSVRTVFGHFADKHALYKTAFADTRFAARVGALWLKNAGVVAPPLPEGDTKYQDRMSAWYEDSRIKLAHLLTNMMLTVV